MPVAQSLQVGQEIVLLKRSITLTNLRLYHGPGINNHTDYAVATGMGLKAPVAGGIMLLGHLSQGFCSLLGQSWLEGGQVHVKFLNYACPGDTLVYKARIKEIGERIELDVQCVSQDGRLIMVGTASAPFV